VAVTPFLETDLRLGRSIALIGAQGGKYPSGNSLLVHGSEETVLIDPSISIVERGGTPHPVDRVLVSHAHEDHLAGVGTFPDAHVHAHTDDLLAIHSLAGLLEVYGMPSDIESQWAIEVERDFFYTPRADATEFVDGQTFDLGGGLRVEVVHLPGHTRGHCGFLVEPDGVFFVADIDLTSFGPYYGDHWSDLEDFEQAITRCRDIEAQHYVTFHHKGVVDGHAEFVKQLDRFANVITDREDRLHTYLSEPRSMEDIVKHRFIYRPDAQVLFADHVERTSMQMHLNRMMRTGSVVESEPGRYRQANV
jgi:glyoxylase-like metal-dependent hydrolase (beta-lactamase superfamily II)